MPTPKQLFGNEDWKDDALCKIENADVQLFFPTNELGQGLMKFRVLPISGNPGYYCSRCSVSDECLNYALSKRIEDGVFGGKSGDERKKFRKSLIRQRNMRM